MIWKNNKGDNSYIYFLGSSKTYEECDDDSCWEVED